MEQENFFRDSEIETSIQRCIDIFNSEIFANENFRSPLIEPCVIMLLIKMNDVLQKLREDGKRIDFTEDVQFINGIKDVTDLINKARNAACHISSGANYVAPQKRVFASVWGRCPQALNIDGALYGSDYEDDIAFFHGPLRVYLKRHLHRALLEVIDIYKAN